MRLTIEHTNEEFSLMYESGIIVLNFAGKNRHFQIQEYTTCPNKWYTGIQHTTVLQEVYVPSEEERKAQEAVTKAEQSLEAAKAALKAVKEKK